MTNDHGDDLRALKRVIGMCLAQAIDLDLPALTHILGRAETSLEAYRVAPPQVPHGRALSASRDRAVRH